MAGEGNTAKWTGRGGGGVGSGAAGGAGLCRAGLGGAGPAGWVGARIGGAETPGRGIAIVWRCRDEAGRGEAVCC